MTDIDTSMYANLTPKPVNPLENMATIAGIKNTLFQNKLMHNQSLGQEMQNKLLGAQVGMAPHYQAAMGPDGMLDANKLNAETAGDPNTAVMTPEVMRFGQEINQPVQVYGPNGQATYQTRQQLQQRLAPEKVQQAHDHFDTMDDALSGLYNDPNLNLQTVTRTAGDLVASGNMKPQEAAMAFSTMPPSDDPEALRKWVGGFKASLDQSRGQFEQQNPRAPVLAAPPPGVVPAKEIAATGAANAMNAMNEAASDAPTRIFQRQKALDALSKTTIGPGAEGRVIAGKAIASLLPKGWADAIPGVDPESDKYFDEAKKYMTQAMIGRAGDMGGVATADKLAAASSGSPNTTLANSTAEDLLKIDIGLERMGMALQGAWNASGQSPDQFNQWKSQWNQQIEPRAFMVDTMKPEQVEKMLSKMKPGEVQKFENTYNMAVQNGMIEEPQ